LFVQIRLCNTIAPLLVYSETAGPAFKNKYGLKQILINDAFFVCAHGPFYLESFNEKNIFLMLGLNLGL